MTHLFEKAIGRNEEVLTENIDADHGLWTALQSRQVLTNDHLQDCKTEVHESLLLVVKKFYTCFVGSIPPS